MAEKRMFAKQIIDSDAFLDMPLSTQALYFHLSMRADDDGFVDNPKKIQRMIGASTDDLKLLIAKRYVLTFESGVIVIKHWRMHNTIQKDRYKETVYLEEKSHLVIKGNKSYTEKDRILGDSVVLETKCFQNGNNMETQIRLDKNRLDKNNKDIAGKPPADPPYKEIIDYLNEKTHSHYRHTTKATQRIINGRLSDNFTVDDFKRVIDIKTEQWLNDKKMSAYLRPETLFAASHFESYLNEARQTIKPESKYPGISEKMAMETASKIGDAESYGNEEFE
ncbi:MAG: DNA replication protein [Lachnospiraceae bacterium]|nr:DNA replication protein [Lachnospiraceae bacterium]